MCGRYVLAGDPEWYAEYFGADRVVAERLEPSYNVSPTTRVYTVAESDNERLLGTMRWGLVPHWAKDTGRIHINARLETVAKKPLFKDSLSRKRCLIPADGFYEWEPREKGHTPHWIYRADGYPMAFAGLWSTWRDPSTNELVRTCAILTTDAVGPVVPIHDRMPLILDEEIWGAWLDRDLTDPEQIVRAVKSIDARLIAEHAVSSRVNSVKNNDYRLTEPG